MSAQFMNKQSAPFERGPSRLRSAFARVQQLLASARPCHTPTLLLSTTVLSLIVCSIGLGNGRTNMMQGAVQVVIFAAFLFLSLVP